MPTVKQIALVVSAGLPIGGLELALLDADRPATDFAPIDLLAAMGEGQDPPEWVRFLAPGINKARDGRAYNVADPQKVVQLSNDYKNGIDLIVDFEHQFDRSRTNGQPAPAAGWIKELAAKGPDGTPGIWAKIDWLPDTVALIKARKYRYLSAAVAHDDKNNVVLVPRASLTNQPAMNTATALFSTNPKETDDMNALLKALLAAAGLPETTTEADAQKLLVPLAALSAALAKQMGLELAALSAMTGDAVKLAFTKPLADKIATLATTAKVAGDAAPEQIIAGIQSLAVDPAKYIARSVYDETAARLATLTADSRNTLIEQGRKAGKLSPGMIKDFVPTLDLAQLTAFLATAPVIVTPESTTEKKPGAIPNSVAELSADDKAAARAAGVTDEIYLKAKQDEAADQARRQSQLKG